MSVSDGPRPLTTSALADQWVERFGELMDAPTLAELLKFGSLRTFRRHAIAGTLPVAVFRVVGRRGWFARTRDAAAWLESAGGSNAAVVAAPTSVRKKRR